MPERLRKPLVARLVAAAYDVEETAAEPVHFASANDAVEFEPVLQEEPLFEGGEPANDVTTFVGEDESDVVAPEVVAPEAAPPDEPVEPIIFAADPDEPPFDPPDANDEIFSGRPNNHAPAAGALQPSEPPKPLAARERERFVVRPLPALTIHATWDRPEIGVLLSAFAADRHVTRADITIERGGLDGAAARLGAGAEPDLFIVDTTLDSDAILAGLAPFAGAVARGTKVVIIGDINDITLLRELATRGVSYVMLPLKPEELVNKVCRLYASFDKARVIAVVGARGGVGASTVAHNLAWSIAERQQATTALVDLDLAFGTAAFQLGHAAKQSIADILVAGDNLDDSLVEQVVVKQTRRLRLLAAPATVGMDADLTPKTLDAMLAQVRRTASFVVLDLPHRWTEWVKHAILKADEIVIVAAPDLASLRNAKNLINEFEAAGRHGTAANVVLSMVGVPQRPDIPLKDITDALGAVSALALPFDPELFGVAAINGRAIAEAAPKSKVATSIDEFASALTGRPVVEQRRAAPVDESPLAPVPTAPNTTAARPRKPVSTLKTRTPKQSEETQAPVAPIPFTFAAPAEPTPAREPVLELVQVATDPNGERYLNQMREAAQAELRPKRRRGAIRLVACLVALAYLVGAWYLESRNEAAAATAPVTRTQPTAEPAALPVTPPAEDAASRYQHALTLIAARDTEGFALLRRAADEGFALAQYRLAKAYETGDGVATDLAAARQWTERAADAGNARAMHDLGVYFANGDGGDRNEATAFRWFRQAAEIGIKDSQFNLGVLYQQGRGVRESLSEALFWFTVAAKQGDDGASARAIALEAELTQAQIEQMRARAVAFRPREPVAAAN